MPGGFVGAGRIGSLGCAPGAWVLLLLALCVVLWPWAGCVGVFVCVCVCVYTCVWGGFRFLFFSGVLLVLAK